MALVHEADSTTIGGRVTGRVVVLYGERAADPVTTYDLGYAFVERRALRWKAPFGCGLHHRCGRPSIPDTQERTVTQAVLFY